MKYFSLLLLLLSFASMPAWATEAPTDIPEPYSLAVFGTGVAALAAIRRRVRRRQR